MFDEEDVSAARQVKLTACIPTVIINYNISFDTTRVDGHQTKMISSISIVT
jgi:hypothetical protein